MPIVSFPSIAEGLLSTQYIDSTRTLLGDPANCKLQSFVQAVASGMPGSMSLKWNLALANVASLAHTV